MPWIFHSQLYQVNNALSSIQRSPPSLVWIKKAALGFSPFSQKIQLTLLKKSCKRGCPLNRQQKRASFSETLCCKTSWKVKCFSFYRPRSNLSIAWILTSDWIILHGNHAIHRLTSLTLNVCQLLVKRENLIDFVAKQYNYSLHNKLRNQQQPYLLQDGSNSLVVERAKPLLNSFCSNYCCNKIAHFSSPFYLTFTNQG